MNENIGNEGQEYRFTSSNQPPPASKRKPKNLIKAFRKKNKLSLEDIRTFVKNILTRYTIDEIKEKIKNKEGEMCALEWGLFVAYMKSCAKGNITALSWMMEICYGKPDQNINVKQQENDITKLSREEMMNEIKKLSAKIIGDADVKKTVKEIVDIGSDKKD